MRKIAWIFLIAVGFAVMNVGCEVIEEPVNETPTGEVCFMGEGYPQDIKVNEPIRVQVIPEGCFSSSCTRVILAECSVTKSPWYFRNPTFTVTSTFELGSTGEPCHTPDCSGGGFANCDFSSGLPEGSYTVNLPDLGDEGTTVTLTVPSEELCIKTEGNW